MSFYHEKENAKEYAGMCEGYDASKQLDMLYKYVPDGASVLELGSGPGNDLKLLASHYRVTGSDYSPAFIEMLKARFSDEDIVMIDAITIATEDSYDAIYSNKVLHHLTDKDLSASFARQADILNPGGIVFHLIWKKVDKPKGFDLEFIERDLETMKDIMGDSFEIVDAQEFGEFEDGDSLAILAKKI